MCAMELAVSLWDGIGTSNHTVRVAVKAMDRKFVRAIRRHHPNLAHRPSAQKVEIAPLPEPVPEAIVKAQKKRKTPVAEETAAIRAEVKAVLRRPSVNKTVMEVSARTGVAANLIVSKCRELEVCAARNEVLYLLHKGGFSLMQLGKIFAKDHTTVLHSVRRHRERTGAL